MKLEICANSLQSALNAQYAGADRVELCIALNMGGITPQYGLIKAVLNEIQIPVHVLIRPRPGNFNFSKSEFDIMKYNIELCKDLGVAGIVSGVLENNDHKIDLGRTQNLVSLSKPLDFTFHRAFDLIDDPISSLQELINLDIDYLLTSGQQGTAIKGLPLLIKLLKLAKDRMIIIPGGGIDSKNIHSFLDFNFEYVHASATRVVKQVESHLFGDYALTESNFEEIKAMLEIVSKDN